MKKKFALISVALCMVMALSGCGMAVIEMAISELKGELLGNDYIISQYDNFGNQVLQVSGDKIALGAEVDSAGEPTSSSEVKSDYSRNGHAAHHYGALETSHVD